MDVGFGTALLFAGGLLAIAAALSGLMRGTVLSIAVLSVTAGLILAEVERDPRRSARTTRSSTSSCWP